MAFSEVFMFNGVEYVIESVKGKHRFHVVNTEIYGDWLPSDEEAEIQFMNMVMKG